MLTSLLSSLGLAPKTLNEASDTLATAKSFADSVNALFTSAGLNLEQLLAAGPDSLKAHLEGIDSSEELAEALQANEELTTNLATLQGISDSHAARATSLEATLAVAGFTLAADAKPADFKPAFEAHVAKQVALALSQTGHPPVAHLPADTDVADTDAAHLAAYQAMPRGPERLEYFAKHEAAIWRAQRAQG